MYLMFLQGEYNFYLGLKSMFLEHILYDFSDLTRQKTKSITHTSSLPWDPQWGLQSLTTKPSASQNDTFGQPWYGTKLSAPSPALRNEQGL